MARDLKTSFSQIEAKEKSYVRLIFLSGGHGPDRNQKSLGFGHLPVVNSKGEPNSAGFRSATVRADFEADWRI